MNKERATKFIKNLISYIGGGYHPDTPMHDYINGKTKKPLFTGAKLIEATHFHNLAMKELGDEIYTIGLAEVKNYIDRQQAFQKFIDEFLDRHGDYLGYLKGRWMDEKEYEDWSDYEKAIRDKLVGYNVSSVFKVGVNLINDNQIITFKFNLGSIKISSITVPVSNKQ